MCLILLTYRPGTTRPLVVAANRDEFHERASQAADFWPEHPDLLAGKDLVAGGTWLGCTRTGRFAALTNFSQDTDPATPKSRGGLVHEFLASEQSAMAYAEAIDSQIYAGFNLLLFDGEQLAYASNITADDQELPRLLAPGSYGLSNAELGAAWPKCIDGASAIADLAESNCGIDELLEQLTDSVTPEDARLPQRQRDIAFERRIAPCFIVGDDYGTRASSAVIMENGHIYFSEQTYLAAGQIGDRVDYDFVQHTDPQKERA
jgi:uncharacterized protein with NRDE domain